MSSTGGFGLQSLGVQFPLLASAGTAPLPSYSFALDPNTGIYNPAADSLGFSTGGTLRLTVSTTLALLALPLVALRVVSPKTGTGSVTDQESRTMFTNAGAAAQITLALPNAAIGLEYTFYIDAAFNVVVTAAGGDTIRLAAAVSVAGGNATSSTVGSSITIVCQKANTWVANSIVGVWAVT